MGNDKEALQIICNASIFMGTIGKIAKSSTIRMSVAHFLYGKEYYGVAFAASFFKKVMIQNPVDLILVSQYSHQLQNSGLPSFSAHR